MLDFIDILGHGDIFPIDSQPLIILYSPLIRGVLVAQKLKRKNGKKKNVLTTPSKINVWLRAFLDDGNPDTFMNRVASVRAAGYKCASEEAFRAMGTYLYQQTQEKILSWMDEVGLSEPALKAKALSLFEANQKALEKMKGRLTKASPGLEVIAETTTTDSEGNDTTELWLSSPVPALETQRKTLDMAFRVRGMYAPEKHAVLAKGDLTVHVETGSEVRALLESIAGAIFGRKED